MRLIRVKFTAWRDPPNQPPVSAELAAAIEAARAAQDLAGIAIQQAAKNHERLRTAPYGYQILNDEGTEMSSLVDEAGEPLPSGAIYEYEVVEVEPPPPAWTERSIA